MVGSDVCGVKRRTSFHVKTVLFPGHGLTLEGSLKLAPAANDVAHAETLDGADCEKRRMALLWGRTRHGYGRGDFYGPLERLLAGLSMRENGLRSGSPEICACTANATVNRLWESVVQQQWRRLTS